MKFLKNSMTIMMFTILFSMVSALHGYADLEIGSPGDGYEQEADRVADRARPNPMEKSSKTMPVDPYGKQLSLFDQNGKKVNLQNKKALKGKTFFDKAGNKFLLKNGKLVKVSTQKKF